MSSSTDNSPPLTEININSVIDRLKLLASAEDVEPYTKRMLEQATVLLVAVEKTLLGDDK